MNVLVILIPVSLILGGLGLGAFLWTLRAKQYDDLDGTGARILDHRWDSQPRKTSGQNESGRKDGPADP